MQDKICAWISHLKGKKKVIGEKETSEIKAHDDLSRQDKM